MSKFLVVNDGDYTLKVQSGGNITLDTGVSAGAVTITGDLIVQGDQTTINTQAQVPPAPSTQATSTLINSRIHTHTLHKNSQRYPFASPDYTIQPRTTTT